MSNIHCGVPETKLIIQVKCVSILDMLGRRGLTVSRFFFYSAKCFTKYTFNRTCGFSTLPFPKLDVQVYILPYLCIIFENCHLYKYSPVCQRF